MKRRLKSAISLLLVVTLLAAYIIIPVHAASGVTAELSTISFTPNDQAIIEGSEIAAISAKDKDVFALKVVYRNETGNDLTVTGVEGKIAYNSDIFQLHSYFDSDEETAGPVIRPKKAQNGVSPKWNEMTNTNVAGEVYWSYATGASNKESVTLSAGATITIGYVLFELREGATIENGDYAFSFIQDESNPKNGLICVADESWTPTRVVAEDYTQKKSVTVTDGASPVLETIAVDPTDHAVYGTEKTYTLTAKSTSGKDITSLCGWNVDKAGLTLTGSQATVTSTTPAGTYTITGSYNGKDLSTTITVDQQPVDTVNLTITDFGKGLPVSGAKVESDVFNVTLNWYTDNQCTQAVTTESFAANTEYWVSAILTLKDSNNYKLTATKATITLGDKTQEYSINGSTVVANAKTAEKTLTDITVTPPAGASYVHGEAVIKGPDFVVMAHYDDNTSERVYNYDIVYVNGGEYFKKGETSYSVTYNGITKTITIGEVGAKHIKITGLTAVDRGYEPNNKSVAIISTSAALQGVMFGEDVYVTYPTTGMISSDNVGTYTVDISLPALQGTDSENYVLDYIESVSVKISRADFTPAVEIKGWAYGEPANTPTVTNNVSGGSVTFLYKEKNAIDYPYPNSVPTAVGEYTVCASVAKTQNYNSAEATAGFTISAKWLDSTDNNVLNIDDVTYTGSKQEPTVSKTITVDSVTLTKGVDFEVEYGDNTNAGVGTVTIKPKAGGNYTFDEIQKTFNIKPIEFKIETSDYTCVPLYNEEFDGYRESGGQPYFIYDGNEHGVKVQFGTKTVNGLSLADLVDVEYTNQTRTNAAGVTTVAKFTVKEQYKNNYSLIGTTQRNLDWYINGAVIDMTGKTIPTLNVVSSEQVGEQRKDYTYDMAWLGVVPTSVTYNADSSQNFEMSLPFDVDTVTGALTFKNVKAYAAGTVGAINVTVKFANYEDVTFTIPVNYVNKLDVSAKLSMDDIEVDYGTEYAPTVKLDGKDVTCTITYTDETGAAVVKPTNVGKYTITAVYSDEEQEDVYPGHTGKVTAKLVINPKALKVEVTHGNITYGDPKPADNGSGYTTRITGLVTGDETPKYTVSTEYEQGNGVGEYDLTCVLDPSVTNYTLAASDVTGKLKVNQKTLTEAMVGSLSDVAYNGMDQKPVPAVTDSAATITTNDYEVTYSGDTKNVGPVPVTVTVTGKNNYTGKITRTFQITAKKLTIQYAAKDKTYDGTTAADVTVTLDGVVSGDDVTLSGLSFAFADKNASADAKTITKSGTPVLSGTAKANYVLDPEQQEPTLTAKINKVNLSNAAVNPSRISVSLRYNDLTAKTIDVPTVTGVVAGDLPSGLQVNADTTKLLANGFQFSSTKDKLTFALKSGLADQEQTAKFPVTLTYDSTNYEGSVSFDVVLNITKRQPQKQLVYTGATTVIYGNTLTLTTSGGSGSGTLTYTITGGTGSAAINGSTLTPTKVGTVQISIVKAADSEYASAETGVTITIVPANVSVDPTYTKIESTGKTLNDVGLTFPGFPNGTLVWKDANGNVLPGTTEVQPNTEYTYEFTPDGGNYNTVTGKLTPFVRNDLSWLPGVINGGSKFSFHDVNRFDYFYDAVRWAVDNGITSGTSRFVFDPQAACTRAQTVTFLWRAAGSPLPRYRVTAFTDINPADYYYNAVLWAVEQGITTGLTATTFGPNALVTRGQVAAFLYRAASAAKPNTVNPFVDVKATAYNYDAILWAYDNRITTGTSTTTFSPDASCTRAQIVTFLYRYYQGR